MNLAETTPNRSLHAGRRHSPPTPKKGQRSPAGVWQLSVNTGPALRTGGSPALHR